MVKFQGKEYPDWAAARAAFIAPAPPIQEIAVAEMQPPVTSVPVSALDGVPVKRKSLTDKYRPRKLADLQGQADVVQVLSAYAADPYPAAFIFG